MHEPVLLQEAIDFLDLKPGKFIIDGTVDGGGHSIEILKKISPGGMLLGVDLDKEVLQVAKSRILFENKKLKSKVILTVGNYADLPEILKNKKLDLADGLILDLGFSSWHLEESKRGFSFLRDEPLIMTYQNKGMTAKDFLNQASLEKIYEVIKIYGEERFARKIAEKIIDFRKKETIRTTKDLREIILSVVPKKYHQQKLHPAAKTFQALRIYLNHELENLKKVLDDLNQIVKSNGRVAIISFHSLEDRLVKNYFKKMKQENKLIILTKKPIQPSYAEILKNPKSRSAKLRVGIIL
ncbi:MAG: 16S rRNA (cytosine(1402)-N(4))-methyltransferase RsmH [Minisyncoccia bacterium]